MGCINLRTFPLSVVITLALAASGCSKAPAEPDRPASAASTQAPTVPPLRYEAPGAWATMDPPKTGPKKAIFKATKAGDDKEEADVEVYFFGTGAPGDPEKHFNEWFEQFDGNVGATAKREKFSVGSLECETVEVAGTYKIALAPPVGPKKRIPMQMVKNDFRLIGAVVKTPDRGNWFFKMVGPNETVQSASGAFRAMLESAK